MEMRQTLLTIMVLILFALSPGLALAQDEGTTQIGVIGGADGPTSIFLSPSGSLSDLIERQLPGLTFQDMRPDALDRAIGALGGIAPGYAFIGRETADGLCGYVVGVLTAPASPLLHTSAMGSTLRDGTTVTTVMRDDGEPLFEVVGARLDYDPMSPVILRVTPDEYAASDFGAVFNVLISGDLNYLADLSARRVTLRAPEAPYLHVTLYAGGVYRSEYIALERDDVTRAMLSSKVYMPDEMGDYAITLVREGEDPNEAFMRNAPLPAPLLDLARERCGFTIGSLGDITRIVSARMTVTALGQSRTQEITDRDALDALTTILKRTAPVRMGNCPYTGVLTLTMEDGRTVVVQKATDSCGTMLLGSMRCHQISRADNQAFWALFDEVRPME